MVSSLKSLAYEGHSPSDRAFSCFKEATIEIMLRLYLLHTHNTLEISNYVSAFNIDFCGQFTHKSYCLYFNFNLVLPVYPNCEENIYLFNNQEQNYYNSLDGIKS